MFQGREFHLFSHIKNKPTNEPTTTMGCCNNMTTNQQTDNVSEQDCSGSGQVWVPQSCHVEDKISVVLLIVSIVWILGGLSAFIASIVCWAKNTDSRKGGMN